MGPLVNQQGQEHFRSVSGIAPAPAPATRVAVVAAATCCAAVAVSAKLSRFRSVAKKKWWKNIERNTKTKDGRRPVNI